MFGKVIFENGNVFSKPTYFKYLKELENENKISVVREGGRQDFIITTFPDAQEAMKLFAKGFDFVYTRLEDYLNILEKNVRRMSDDEKAEYITSLVRLIQYEEWLLSCYAIKTIQHSILLRKLMTFRHKVYHFMISCSTKDPLKISNLVSSALANESQGFFSLHYSALKERFS